MQEVKLVQDMEINKEKLEDSMDIMATVTQDKILMEDMVNRCNLSQEVMVVTIIHLLTN